MPRILRNTSRETLFQCSSTEVRKLPCLLLPVRDVHVVGSKIRSTDRGKNVRRRIQADETAKKEKDAHAFCLDYSDICHKCVLINKTNDKGGGLHIVV